MSGPNLFDIFDVEPEDEGNDSPLKRLADDDGVARFGIAPMSTDAQLVDDFAKAIEPEVMPADFQLPALVKFVPNVALKLAVERAAADAQSLQVVGNDGLQRADVAVENLRGAIEKIKSEFHDPKSRAYKLHKWISGKESEWTNIGQVALDDISKRIITEHARLDAIAREETRANQAQADEDARMATARAAVRAEQDGQPKATVEQLRQQASTAKAPPVAPSMSAPIAPKSSTIKKEYKARLVGTADDADEQNPSIKELTDAQRLSVLKLCKAITDGKCPISVIKELDWAYLNKRADAENTTLAIPGIEVFEVTALRKKPQRGRR